MDFVGKIAKTTENPENKYKILKYIDLYLIFRRFSILFIDLVGVHEVLSEYCVFIADVVDHGLNDREKFWEFVLENPFRNLICGPVNYGRGRVFFRSWIVRSRYGFGI